MTVKGKSIHDITKMSKQQRVKASLKGKDPLSDLGTPPPSGIY